MSNLFWYPGHELLLGDIVRAEGCYLYDSKGKRYVDLESGVWCTSLGHGDIRIVNTIARQFTQIAHTGFNYSSRIVEEAAKEILSLLGFEGGKCVLVCSGSEAVEYAVRIAQRISDGPLLMTMNDSYLGAYGSANMMRADEWYCFDWSECAGCREYETCLEQCKRWAAIPFNQIGGFLFEPGSSSGLVRFPPEKLIRSIVCRLKENDGIILINEVTTGIGRTGTWFGYEHYGISPDVVALGKGIGNGYPVSATACSSRIVDRLGNESIKYAQSHQNDAAGAAVALEVIRIIKEEKLIDRSRGISSLLSSGLEEIKARTGKIKEIRGRGLMIAIELKDDAEATFGVSVHRRLVERGFIAGLRPKMNVLRIDPSLTIGSEDIEYFLKALEDVLVERD